MNFHCENDLIWQNKLQTTSRDKNDMKLIYMFIEVSC